MEPTELINSENKNTNTIYCIKCNCLIMQPNIATFMEKEISLHFSRTNSGEENPELLETKNKFWFVDDMWLFENIGFTNTTQNYKYLTCADCEQDVLGIQYLNEQNGKNFYLSFDRVKYDNTET